MPAILAIVIATAMGRLFFVASEGAPRRESGHREL